MSVSSKRRHDVVDLTGEEVDDQSQPKRPRLPLAELLDLGNSSSLPITLEDDDESAANEIILTSTQSHENDTIAFTLIGEIDAKIVGVRYYNGFATVGETVLIRREPSNQYDRNAIRVDNVQGTQIGHIPRNLAAKLAPYLDNASLKAEATLTGEKGMYDCPVMLHLFATSEFTARQELEARMKADRLPLIKKGRLAKTAAEKVEHKRKKLGYQGTWSNSYNDGPDGLVLAATDPGLEQLIQGSERFNPREIEQLVEQWGAPEEALKAMPPATQPSSLESELLPYQLQGLKWMLNMEDPKLPAVGSKDVVQLWKRAESKPQFFQNIATRFTTTTPPVLASGGILADDMGLGKTLQIISLILEGGPGATLVVAPVSVMSNWSQQIERHVKSSKPLRVLTYHGANRNGADLTKYDVVITSYGTLSAEYNPNGSSHFALLKTNWRRVVLDEGHIIRNPSTKAALAATSLNAKSRWVLTGTPIVNSVRDLYSMLKYLRIPGGLDKAEIFNTVLTRPLTNGDPEAVALLQTLIRTMCLRRTKQMSFIDLRIPELSEYIHRIPFRRDEKEKYKALELEAKGLLRNYEHRQEQPAAKGDNAYRNLLEILLRLRQVCCHWTLCGDRVNSLLQIIESQKVVELTAENRLALQALLALSIDNRDECPICLETVHNPVITACKHVFGRECIERTIQEQLKCPMCRAPIRDAEQLVHPAVEEGQVEGGLDVDSSSKVEALINILKASRQDPKSKVVIFSQWTSFLNIIQSKLDDYGYKYTRLDGTMPARARDAAIAALDNDADTKIMLASLAVCSVGLNLVSADTVILADSWFAPAIEDQAVDRVHRLGQKRKTTVWRLIMEESIEERVLDIQREKRQLVGKAFQEKGKKTEEKHTRLADIQKLLA